MNAIEFHAVNHLAFFLLNLGFKQLNFCNDSFACSVAMNLVTCPFCVSSSAIKNMWDNGHDLPYLIQPFSLKYTTTWIGFYAILFLLFCFVSFCWLYCYRLLSSSLLWKKCIKFTTSMKNSYLMLLWNEQENVAKTVVTLLFFTGGVFSSLIWSLHMRFKVVRVTLFMNEWNHIRYRLTWKRSSKKKGKMVIYFWKRSSIFFTIFL